MKYINSCPLKGNHFDECDLKILNDNKEHDNYKDLLKEFRENIKVSDRAWIAGIIDGEGYISIIPKKLNSGNKSLRATIAIESNTPIMQLKIADLLKTGKLSNKRNRATRINLNKNYEIVAFLELIIPYLVVKKQIAKFVREYCLRRLNKEEICEYDYIIYEKVKESNKRFVK